MKNANHPNNVIGIDFETYYSREFSLSKIPTQKYVLSPHFETIGVAVKLNDEDTQWFTGTHEETKEFLDQFPWEDAIAVAHNAMFDGAILEWLYDIHPARYFCTMMAARPLCAPYTPNGRVNLKYVSEYLRLGVKGTEVLNALGKRRKDFTPEEMAKYAEYCRNDTALSVGIYKKLSPQLPEKEQKLIDATIKKFTQPQFKLNRQVLSTRLAIVKQAKSNAMAMAGVSDRSELMSNDKFAEILQRRGVVPPTKTSERTGKTTWAFAKNDMKFKELLDHHDPIVSMLVAARMKVKSTGEETRLERFIDLTFPLDEHDQCFAIPLLYYGAHCLTGDAEVLTPEGWQRLDKWSGGDIVQAMPDGSMKMLPASRHVGEVATQWVEVDAPYYKASMTLGHRVPYIPHGAAAHGEMSAAELATRATTKLPIAGILEGGDSTISPDEARLIAAIQADGHFTPWGQLQIFVKKPRKIQRARMLLDNCAIIYRELEFDSCPGFVRFVVSKADAPTWMGPANKQFGPHMMQWSTAARRAFLAELPFWDGWIDHSGKPHYTTTNRDNAEWVVTLGAISGKPCNISHTKPPKGNRVACYDVGFRTRNNRSTQVKAKHITLSTHKDTAYCAKTQTGYFLCRQRGSVFITGNTGRFSGMDKLNLQNLGRGSELRRALEAPEGYKVVAGDLSQIEARITATLAGQTDLVEQFASGADPYSIFATKVYGYKVSKAPETKSERFVGKTCILGLQYGVGHKKLYLTLKAAGIDVTEDQCYRFVDIYRVTYSNIKRLWKLADKAIASMRAGCTMHFTDKIYTKKEAIALPNGMQLVYPNLRRTDEGWVYDSRGQETRLYGAKLIENLVQALARIVVSEAELYLYDRGYHAALQVHDELVYVVHEQLAEKFAQVLEKVLNRDVEWMPELPVASEVAIGDNYYEAK